MVWALVTILKQLQVRLRRLSIVHNLIIIDSDSTFNDVLRKMTSYAKNLTIELEARNIVPKHEDNANDVNLKERLSQVP